MRIVVVRFKSSARQYEFKTELPMIKDGVYNIIADGRTSYSSPVIVDGYRAIPQFKGELRQITKADCIQAPPAPDDNIQNVIFNEEKRTTVVIWKDGIKTILKCAPEDVFDKEKAIALAYMKRAFKNRGCFNEVFKKWVKEDVE